MSKYEKIQEAHTTKLLKKNGVIGTAVGKKWVNGIPTDQEAVLVFVQKKFSNDGVIRKYSSKDIIPSSLDGIPTDIIEVGEIKKQNSYKSRVRPIKPGYSIGHGKITAGTLGGIFKDRDGDIVVLSNNHVIANENNAKVGDLIYQPGPTDSRANRSNRGWTNPVGNLPHFATLKDYVKLRNSGNIQDSAIAKIHPKYLSDGLVDDIYPTINSRLTGFTNAKVGSQVQKCGRTTGYTTGRVIGTNASFSISYDFGVAQFNKCVVLSAMSKGGDSGSIIQDMDEKAIALLFAGSDKVTIANPIDIVRKQYGLELWTPNIAPPAPGKKAKPLTLASKGWETFVHNQGMITKSGNVLKIHARANHHCCLSYRISQFKSAQCTINTGSGTGATWGTGLVIQWPNGYIKVNLRPDSFGGYVNGSFNINVGKTKKNTDYKVRIRKYGSNYLGEVYDSGKWNVVVSVPTRVFPNQPTAVRIGKTNLHGVAASHHAPGAIGDSTIKDFVLT